VERISEVIEAVDLAKLRGGATDHRWVLASVEHALSCIARELGRPAWRSSDHLKHEKMPLQHPLESPMRKSRFTDEQMVAILREADRSPIAEVAKKHKVSEQTIYTWRKRFGAMEAADAKRLKTLESENNRLKKLVAERDLEIEVMKEIAAKKW
jgi:putative transposase